MCRVLSYMGQPLLLGELLYEPDNAFVKQSYNPRFMSHLLNLAGFGMIAWDANSHNPFIPYVYKTTTLPFYDDNLRYLSLKIRASCLLAHLRGVTYSEKQIISRQNIHPFIYEKAPIALAHNGILADFKKMKFDLLEYIHSDYRQNIRGTTDSEWIYALLLSQINLEPNQNLTKEQLINAIMQTFKILQELRQKHNIHTTSPVNLFLTDGNLIAATRFAFDYGWPSTDLSDLTHMTYHSLWYTCGLEYGYYQNEFKMKENSRNRSIIVASEPLTEDTSTWIEIPEYTLIIAQQEEEEIAITSHDIMIV